MFGNFVPFDQLSPEEDNWLKDTDMAGNIIDVYCSVGQNLVNIFLQIKLENLEYAKILIKNYIMESDLCMLRDEENMYYIRYYIDCENMFWDGSLAIPYTKFVENQQNYLDFSFDFQLIFNITEEDECQGIASILSVLAQNLTDNSEQYNFIITDRNPADCLNPGDFVWYTKDFQKHLDIVILNDGSLNGQVYNLSNDLVKYFKNDPFSTKRLNHGVIIKTADIENAVKNHELCMCQMEVEPAPLLVVYAPPTNQPKTTPYVIKQINSDTHTILYITLLLSLALMIAMVIAFIFIYKKKQQQKILRMKIEELHKSQAATAKSIFGNVIKTRKSQIDDPYFIDDSYLQINFTSVIGTGASSEVYKGFLIGSSPLHTSLKLLETHQFQDCDVVIKIPNNLGLDETIQITREIEVMKRIIYHPNIIALLGWTIYGEAPSLIMEVAHSDLLSYARSLRQITMPVPLKVFVAILWQISNGMSYIASLNMVHRDLAARNILLTKEYRAKITDFGLCCNCDETFTYTASINKRLPMKWLALESLIDRTFSEKSDVWSFGILMYEVFSMGTTPYAAMNNVEMLSFLKSGKRLERPDDTDDKMYEIMQICWQEDPNHRPNFETLQIKFRKILELQAESYGYLPYSEYNESSRRSSYKLVVEN